MDFNQKIKYVDKGNRVEFFKDLIRGKAALHYGCADWPIFNIDTNLHYKLIKTNKDLVGYDIDKETIDKMSNLAQFKGSELCYDKKKLKQDYDIVLVPETIEHVFNMEEFVLEISSLGKEILVTAPNALCSDHYNRNKDDGKIFTEIVHPDHKYWFSLYTLMNSIRMILDKNNIKHNIEEVGFLENRTMVYCKYSMLQ